MTDTEVLSILMIQGKKECNRGIEILRNKETFLANSTVSSANTGTLFEGVLQSQIVPQIIYRAPTAMHTSSWVSFGGITSNALETESLSIMSDV